MSFELPTPPRSGPYTVGSILSTFPPKPLSDRVTQEFGATWERESCALPVEFDANECPPAPVVKPAAVTSRGEADPVAPFGYYASYYCAGPSVTQESVNAEALRILTEGRTGYLSAQLNDLIAAHPDLVPGGGPFDPSCGLAQAQGYIASILGRSSYIFAPPSVISRWTEGHAVYADGNVLRTVLGNTVIVLPGDGLGPTLPIYVTDGAVDIYLSGPKTLSDEAASRLRRDNTIIGAVEELALFAWDPCQVASFTVDICG